jgi:hypothetical protein
MISIIICSIDHAKFAQVTQNYTAAMGDEPFEIIAIHDATSLAEGYNRGIARSTGSILIFSHDDIEIVTPDFATKLKAHLARYDIVGPAGTSRLLDGFWPHAGTPFLHGCAIVPPRTPDGPFSINLYDNGAAILRNEPATPGIQALDGFFIAARREVVERVRFDEITCDGFHLYDVDFTYAAYLAGFRLAAFCDIGIIHYSRGAFDTMWEEYNARFLAKYANDLPSTDQQPRALPNWTLIGFATKAEVARAFNPENQCGLAVMLAAEACPASTEAVEPSGVVASLPRFSIWKLLWTSLFRWR